MALRKYESAERAMDVAKEAIWLAWQACGGPMGMGILQDKPDAERDAVWDCAYHQRDYTMRHGGPESVSADYVFGRMMKLYFRIEGDSINVPDHEPRWDYQGWCGKYKTYAELFDAAERAGEELKAA